MARRIWTPEQDRWLEELWSAGHPIRKMGAIMGITRNSVIGRVHRLNLPQRGSPLFAKGQWSAPVPEVYPLPELPPSNQCPWPIGEPGTRDFRYCARKVMFNRPLCVEHIAHLYTLQRTREPLPQLPPELMITGIAV